MQASAIFLQAGTSAGYINMIMIALMVGIFYLFILRPQQRRQKEQADFQDTIKKGDQVVTNAGILGRVSKIDKEAGTITLEVSKGNYIDFTTGSMSRDLTLAKYGKDKTE